MKLVLSRKGFDSGSGGCPSPILPDGRMLSLPIPDPDSPACYSDLSWGEVNVGELVNAVTKGKVAAGSRAHVDPDVRVASLRREAGWKPLFGQVDAAQGHLRNQGVGIGDLFLFFGLFRRLTRPAGRWVWEPGSRPLHVIWGWLQIGEVVPVDTCPADALPWARSHPHFHRPPSTSNTLYVAKDKLELPGIEVDSPGAGVFPTFSEALQLTDPSGRLTSDWIVPEWMAPRAGRPSLTYHGNPDKWSPTGNREVRLKSVGRGQEFVLDTSHYPEAADWLRTLLST